MSTVTGIDQHRAQITERARLVSWSRRRKTGQALALRANIVLAAAEGLSNSEIAERLGVSRPTVTKWRNRFSQRRLEGLLDEPRPGRPRTVSDEQVETIVITTLESARKGRHGLVHALAGGETGCQPELGLAHLAGVRAPTAPPGEVQALNRPAVRREGR